MKVIDIRGANAPYARAIREVLESLPGYYLAAARLSFVEVSTEPDVREMTAVWDHGTRKLRVMPNAGQILRKAIVHELTHAVDDNFGYPHFFSGRDDWKRLHQAQSFFDIPKYREEPLEYLADVGAKYFILGREKLKIPHPEECAFFEQIVLATLSNAFGEKQ